MAVGFRWSPKRYDAAPPLAPRSEENGADNAAAAAAAAWWELWVCRWEGCDDNTLLAWWTRRAVLHDWGLIDDHLLLFDPKESSDSLPEKC